MRCHLCARAAVCLAQHTLKLAPYQPFLCPVVDECVHGCCRPSFDQITKDLQILYQDCRKKPLQSASSAPSTLEQKKLKDRRSTGPPAPSSGPLRVRPSTADISDLTPPKVGRSAFKSVTETSAAWPRSRIQSVAEQDESFNQSPGGAYQQSPPQQAPPPPVAGGVSSPFAQVPGADQQGANSAFAPDGNIPTLEEAEQRMAAAPTPVMPPASEMRGNPRSSTSWRAPASLQQE